MRRTALSLLVAATALCPHASDDLRRRTALSLLVAATALCPHASDDLRMVVGTYTDTGCR